MINYLGDIYLSLLLFNLNVTNIFFILAINCLYHLLFNQRNLIIFLIGKYLLGGILRIMIMVIVSSDKSIYWEHVS